MTSGRAGGKSREKSANGEKADHLFSNRDFGHPRCPMVKPIKDWTITKCILVFTGTAILTIGCVKATTPNTSAIYRIPSISNQRQTLPEKSKSQTQYEFPGSAQILFVKVNDIDNVLAIEIGRLPEFQGQISDLEVRSLSRFLDLLIISSPQEKSNLKKLLEVGKPNFRRYCSPLQAIFWLLEKEDYNTKESPFSYSLNTLLKKSWKFSEKDRWDDYDIVTDRLNAPELVSFYEIRQFYYETHPGEPANSYWLFKSKKGDCKDVTAFSVYCLKKGGYKAREYPVPSPTGLTVPHWVTLFEVDGNEYIMDNGRPDTKGIVPFSKYSPF